MTGQLMTGPVIAIDGPAAAGKGTLARRLASELGLPYLDTGLLYRVVGRRVLDAAESPADAAAATRAAAGLRAEDLQRGDLRGPAADAAASTVAAVAGVRAALLAFQRQFATAEGAVLDGRDIGTVVFPEADVKLFVTASLAARAERRCQELRSKGENVALDLIEREMRERDERDSSRASAPMQPAEDAVLLDTTLLDADAAFGAALAIVRRVLSRQHQE